MRAGRCTYLKSNRFHLYKGNGVTLQVVRYRGHKRKAVRVYSSSKKQGVLTDVQNIAKM